MYQHFQSINIIFDITITTNNKKTIISSDSRNKLTLMLCRIISCLVWLPQIHACGSISKTIQILISKLVRSQPDVFLKTVTQAQNLAAHTYTQMDTSINGAK